jgi:galactonate dehydratase
MEHHLSLTFEINSGLSASGGRRTIDATDEMRGPYDDQVAFSRDAGRLAESLLSEGFTAMKIWPLDIYAAATGGHMISLEELKAGLEPVPQSARRRR